MKVNSIAFRCMDCGNINVFALNRQDGNSCLGCRSSKLKPMGHSMVDSRVKTMGDSKVNSRVKHMKENEITIKVVVDTTDIDRAKKELETLERMTKAAMTNRKISPL